MYKQGLTGMAIGLIVAIIALVVVGYLAFSNRTAGPELEDEITDGEDIDDNVTPPDTTGDINTFRGSFQTGFEGSFTNVNYALSYPSKTFTVSANGSTITMKEGSRTHTITIFNNVGAGFGSSAEAYEGAGGKDFCVGCVAGNTDFKPAAGTDVKMWQSATREVIVYKHAPGFVIIKLTKPSDAARQVAVTLAISTSATTPPADGKTMNVKIYLVKNFNVSCDQTVPTTKTIPLTQAPATAAINLLLQDSSYPTGSKLKSLSITNGVASADFNDVTDSGGGACIQTARVEQIKDTLLQFDSVKSVRITVEGRSLNESFQP